MSICAKRIISAVPNRILNNVIVLAIQFNTIMAKKRSIFRTSSALIDFEECKFKNNIVQKLGGEDQFQFLVISFCERIRNDRLLKKCYKNLDDKSLIDLQKDMILTSFVDVSPAEYEILRSKLILRHHLTFQEGRLPQKQYEALEKNFEDAMRDVWVEEEVLELCRGYFGAIESVLKDSSSMTRRSKIEDDAYVNRLSFGMTGKLAFVH
ncbi:unnamed protein product [Cylindrotheca closterium]|uniref:Uncharacterized protein n=1 Tax=Cylindrotheca closterium TaxID=2856 RepID=A0AAD2CS00_9STRA|nr:unnamed protein product [Cylindrotheca closterium]